MEKKTMVTVMKEELVTVIAMRLMTTMEKMEMTMVTVMEMEMITLEYACVEKIARDLKATDFQLLEDGRPQDAEGERRGDPAALEQPHPPLRPLTV